MSKTKREKQIEAQVRALRGQFIEYVRAASDRATHNDPSLVRHILNHVCLINILRVQKRKILKLQASLDKPVLDDPNELFKGWVDAALLIDVWNGINNNDGLMSEHELAQDFIKQDELQSNGQKVALYYNQANRHMIAVDIPMKGSDEVIILAEARYEKGAVTNQHFWLNENEHLLTKINQQLVSMNELPRRELF